MASSSLTTLFSSAKEAFSSNDQGMKALGCGILSLILLNRIVRTALYSSRSATSNQRWRYSPVGSLCNHESEPVEVVVQRLRREFDSKRTSRINNHGRWDAEWREQQLWGIHDLLKENADELFEATVRDIGKPYAEFSLELTVVLADIRGLIKNLRSWMDPEAVPTPLFLQPSKSYILREPRGLVLVLGPWNFPLNLIVLPLCAALAAGNACILKPSEHAPAQADFYMKYISRYVDPSAVSVVLGDASVASKLVESDIDHCFFTGSTKIGALIASSCAKRSVSFSLELGGKCPVVIDRDCDLTVMARRVVQGKLMNGGQICLSPDYLVIIGDESRAREVLEKAIIPEIERQFGADIMDHPERITRIINSNHFARIKALLDQARDFVVYGGTSDVKKLLIQPTVLYFKDSKAVESFSIFNEEIFGPLLPVVHVATVEDAVKFISKRPNPLAAYIFSNTSHTVETVIDRVNSGGVCVNDTLFHASSPSLPFGGIRQSGVGRYHGRSGFDELSNAKSILKRSEWLDSSLRYYPALRDENVQAGLAVVGKWVF